MRISCVLTYVYLGLTIVGEVKATVLHRGLEDLAHEVVHVSVVLRLAADPLARLRIHGHQLEAVVHREYAVDPRPHLADDPQVLHIEIAIDHELVLLASNTHCEEMKGRDRPKAHPGGDRDPLLDNDLRQLTATTTTIHTDFTATVRITTFQGPLGKTSITLPQPRRLAGTPPVVIAIRSRKTVRVI
jgi:hypothetical protein